MKRKSALQKLTSIIVLLLVAYLVWNEQDRDENPLDQTRDSKSVSTAPDSDDIKITSSAASSLKEAIRNQSSDLQVEGRGEVIKLLRDDNEGSRHQKFLIRLDSGQTLLIAHNIDLAPRLDTLSEGDTVEFYGEYEWNDRGGVIHWTHHDPQQRHESGWLKHAGKVYQ